MITIKKLFSETHPHLIAEISENNTVNYSKLTPGSSKELLWSCTKNHEWIAKIKTRTAGHGCPYCSNRKILPGYNDLTSTHPHIAQQWDHSRNQNPPESYGYGSNHKAHWLCDNNHSWVATISDRTRKGNGCPVCSHRKADSGVNSLLVLYPEIAEQCLSDVDMDTVLPHSSKILEWGCPFGHSYEEPVRIRVRRKQCKLCSSDHAEKNKAKRNGPRENLLSQKNRALFDQLADKESHSEISYNSAKKVGWLCENNHYWVAPVYQRYNGGTGCPECMKNHYSSVGENELGDYIRSIYDGEIRKNVRDIITPYELDIYVPDKNIALEYNGLYWHSEQNGKDRLYHHDKWLACHRNGIQLITIWEDDWLTRKEIVMSSLSHKFGLNDSSKVYARRTTVEYVGSDKARIFCDTHHIQGYTPGSIYLGLKEKESGNIVAMSVWRRNRDILYLDRYCTNLVVVGGMGKVLEEAKNYARENNLSRIVTFSDNDISNGGLYEKLGFTLDKKIRPDYKYVINKTRVHKFNYRLRRFREDDSLLFRDGLSESQLASLNNIPRVWDSGKIRWVIEI